jgi:hypothetical protein
MSWSPRVRLVGPGEYELSIEEGDREALGALVSWLRQQLVDEPPDDGSLRRLFPPAYPDDPERDAEYHHLMHDDLLERRLASLDLVEETLGADRIDEPQLLAWMGALNDLRLVFGTRLDVSDHDDPFDVDPDHPDAQLYLLYGALGLLLEDVVAAASP